MHFIQYQYRISLCLGTTTMIGKTWLLSRRQSSTPSTGRISHSRLSLKGLAVRRALYRVMFVVVGGGEQATGITAAFRRLSSKADWRTWASFTKAEALVGASRATTHRRLQKLGCNHRIPINPLLNPETTSEACYLGWGEQEKDQSSFQIKVNLAFHLEVKVPECGGKVERHRIQVAWTPVVELPQSVMTYET